MKLITLLLITISLSGCSKSSNSASSPLLPLTIGNRWNFNIYTFTDSVSTIFTDSSFSSSVTDTISYNGHTYYKISNNNNIAYRNVDNNTVEQYDGIHAPSIAFKRVSKDSDAVNGNFYGVTALQDVNDLSCIRNTEVIINGLVRDSINYFLCPGVGLVRNEHWYKNAANNYGYYLLTRQDLASYNFN